MEAYLDWQKSGGIKLNDVIEEYRYVAAGKQIKAGDLVNYINGVAGKTDLGTSTSTTLSSTQYSGQIISAVQLDENRVFIAHSYGSSYYLYGIVCRIEGNTITHGTDTGLYISQYGGARVSAVLLQNGDVFIAHSRESAYRLTGTVCKINDMEITVTVKATQLSTMQNTGYTISTCVLPNGNVFIAHNYGNNTQYHLYGMVVTISDATITAGTDTALVSSSNAGSAISTCLLPNGNIFIAHSYGSNYYLYGIVCSISGTTITKGSDTQLVYVTSAGSQISTCLLPNGNVFVTYPSASGEEYCLYGMVVSISGTSVTKGINTQISPVPNTGVETNLILLDNGQVLIIFSYGTSYYIYGMIVSIDGTTIIAGTHKLLNGADNTSNVMSTLLLDNDTIFVAHSNSTSYYLNAQIFGIDYENNIPTNHIVITEYEQQVTPAIEPPFNAVALSSGEGAPEFVEEEVKKTGNIFPTSWTQIVEGTKYSSSDGYVLEANSYEGADYKVCNLSDLYNDGTVNTGSAWRVDPYLETNNHWASITCPKPTKITKMKTYFDGNTHSYTIRTQIQGKKNSSDDWVDLATLINGSAGYIETALSNTDFYDQYRLYVTVPDNFWNELRFGFFVWEVLEYAEKALIPSTEHNEQVKIARPNVGVI